MIIPCFNAARSCGRPSRPSTLTSRSRSSWSTTPPPTPRPHAALTQLEAEGVHVIRQAVNGGVGGGADGRAAGDRRRRTCSRSTPTTSRSPAQLTRAADRLDADPDAAACVGDYEEFGTHSIIRTVPDRLDPYRVGVHQRVRDHGADAPQRARGATAAGRDPLADGPRLRGLGSVDGPRAGRAPDRARRRHALPPPDARARAGRQAARPPRRALPGAARHATRGSSPRSARTAATPTSRRRASCSIPSSTGSGG